MNDNKSNRSYRANRVTIGLEIHAELNTATKMFCGCRNIAEDGRWKMEDGPNTLVCPICLGLPGALPFANEQAIAKTYLIARAMNCELAQNTHWERKNYFYPDLPKGFQISQYAMPIGERGKLSGITVRRVHLEEDTGKLIHQQGVTLVDFNRSGVPLVELVTEPEIRSAKQAVQVAKEYQLVLRYLGASAADMEKGQFRVEANVSVRRLKNPSSGLGTKVEIKNLNSFRAVERAIDHEINRQSELLEADQQVQQETRGWNEAKQQTVPQRLKETESDYRYFPEPDLPPVTLQGITRENKGKLRVPELPEGKRAKLKAIGLTPQYIEVLVADPTLVGRFEGLLGRIKDDKGKQRVARLLVNWPEVRTRSDEQLIKLAELPEHQLKLAVKGEPIEELQAVSQGEIERAVELVLEKNRKAVADFQSGKQAALGFLLGQLMRGLKHADPKVVGGVLSKRLTAGSK